MNQLVGRTHQRKSQQQSKPKDIHRGNISDSPRSVSLRDQGDCTTESHRSSTTEVHTINPGSQNRSIYEAEANKNSLANNGKTKNNPQVKGKEEVSERMLNEIEASQLSDIEFKTLVIRKLNELTENYQKLQGNCNELTANYINMKKEIQTINKGQEEMNNKISELKNTVEGIKSRLNEAEDWISELEDKVEKTPRMIKKRKRGSESVKTG